MTARLLAVWLLLALLGCNAASEAAPGQGSPTLRIVRRTHPDPAWMTAQLQGRMGLCRLVLRAKGVELASVPPLPNAATIAQWVTVEEEELYANGQRAFFSTELFVAPNADKSCQWTFYKTVHASTETQCAGWYAASAERSPNPDVTPEPPTFSEEAAKGGPDRVKRCLTESTKPLDTAGLPRGITPGGQPCVWIADVAAAAGPVEPKVPGLYTCVHPRYFDGSLARSRRGDALTLRVVRVLPAGAMPGGLDFGMPETNAGRMEAEIVEEGKPIAADRFSRQAVESFVKQALVVPVGG